MVKDLVASYARFSVQGFIWNPETDENIFQRLINLTSKAGSIP